MKMGSDGGWRTVVIGMMSSILLTGLVAWFTFGGGVTRAEGDELKKVDRELQTQQAVITEKLARQQQDINELKQTVKESNEATQKKLDSILDRLPRDGR